MDKLKEIKDLRQGDSGMRVPDNYFEDFTARMDSLLDKEINETPIVDIKLQSKKSSILVKFKPFFYLAAMYIALFVFIKIFIKEPVSTPDLISSSDHFTEDQLLIEDEMYASISDYDLMEYLYANAN